MMRSVFLAAALLINAPVYADDAREFSAFLEKYTAFAEKRSLQNNSHTARFSGDFTFKESCGSFYSEDVCKCPPGNHLLQCLVSAKAVIHVDPNDIGGRGYVLIQSGSSALNNKGQWVPVTERGVYTTVIEPLTARHVINIPIPPKEEIDGLCAGAGGPISVSVGYGAAMPMEIEFARRMKARSEAQGNSYDEQGFIFSRARLNGTKPKKGAVVGVVECDNRLN